MFKSPYLFTYIIGYRNHPDRINNLKRVIDWLSRFNGIEIILVEQDSSAKLSSQDLRGKYVFTKSSLPYNRSWAFNVGLRYATTDRIFFGDSDLIMNPSDIINSIRELDKVDVVNPYSRVIDTTPQELGLDNDTLFKLNRTGRGEADHQKINFSGGIVLFKKEAIVKIGGFPEEFIGWGGEDNAVTNKIERFLTTKQMESNCIHLYHPQAQPDMTYYSNNLQLLDKIINMNNDQMMYYINTVSSKIGSANKYEESELFI